MGLRISNGFFKISDGVFTSREAAIAALSGTGQIFRITNVSTTTDSFSYQKIDGSTETISSITSGSIYYFLALSGSLTDQRTGSFAQLPLTNLLITSSVEETPTFTEVILNTVGSGSWTKPAGVTQVIVECWSGGGAGGGCTTNGLGGNGGAGGQFVRKLLTYSSAQQSIPYVIGAGGTGGTGNGTSGLPTTWNSTAAVAIGGAGGLANQLDSGETIATASGAVGDIVFIGSNGGAASAGIPSGVSPGAGANGPGSCESPINPSPTDTNYQEFGGNFISVGSVITTGGWTGLGGNIYGGGGEGGAKVSGGNRTGGNGAQGLIRIIYR